MVWHWFMYMPSTPRNHVEPTGPGIHPFLIPCLLYDSCFCYFHIPTFTRCVFEQRSANMPTLRIMINRELKEQHFFWYCRIIPAKMTQILTVLSLVVVQNNILKLLWPFHTIGPGGTDNKTRGECKCNHPQTTRINIQGLIKKWKRR